MRREPIPLWAGRFVMPGDDGMSGLVGLGDCPAGLFPNINSPGFCTNIPTDQQSSNGGGGYSAPPAALPSVIAPPVDTGIVQANQAARFGLQLTEDRATQERLVAEVIAEAAVRGLTASCHIATNTAPAMGPLAAYTGYAGYCSVGGGGEDSAAQLLLPGHLDVYSVANPGAIPRLSPPASSPSSSPGAPRAVQTPVAPTSTPPTSTTTGAPVPVSAGSGFDPTAIWSDVNSTVAPFADKLGVPSWALLAAAGVAAFMVFGGKRL